MSKFLLLFSLMFYTSSLFAEGTFITDITKIKKKIGEQEIDAHVNSNGKIPLEGEYLESIMPTLDVDPSQTCAEEEESEPKKGVHYEVIFMGQANTQPTSTNYLATNQPKHTQMASEMITFAAGANSMSEVNLTKALAGMIRNRFSSEEDRFNALSSFSARLYQNYNNARNPGYNTKANNPYDKPLPGGDLTLNQITKAAFDWKKFDGGVCNDISEAVAMIGEELFPDKDVLTVNQGTHFGVVISDGKTNRIIDSWQQYSAKNDLFLNPEYTSTNMRISKLDKGHLKEIAVMDSQTGQMMESAFQTGKPLLKSSTDIGSFVTHFKVVDQGEKKKHELTIGVGAGDLNRSKMYVVVAKYEYNSERWRNYVGVGGSAVNFDTGKTAYQLHLRAGSELGIVRYASPKLSLNLTSGVQLETMYGFSNPEAYSIGSDMGGSIDLVNRGNLVYRPNSKITLHTDLEVRNTLGPTSWGNSTGAWAKGTGSGIGGIFTDTSFHLNQINASAGVEEKLGSSVTAFQEVKYQGSNVGQSLSGLAGLNISAPKGVQIMVFTGYTTTKLPGYMTQHSLLVGSNGAIVGAGLQTTSGILLTGTVSSITASAPPVVSAGISIPLGAPSKKRAPAHDE